MPEVVIQSLPPYKIMYDLPIGTNLIIMIGGRGSGKTYEASKWIAFQSTIKKKRCAILRDEKSLIRESIMNEVSLRYDTANENGILDQFYDKLENGIKDKKTGEMLVFTKGFRASDNRKRANLKSISNVDYAIIEEAEDIRDETSFNTFIDGIRNEGSIVVVILNTPDINHFLIKAYFNCIPGFDAEGKLLDGYFEVTPKKLDGFLCIQTSFRDNPFLPEHVIGRYQAYGNPESHLYNPFYFHTAIQGLASTGRKGQILTKVKPIKLADYMALPFKEVYGQDFGTSSPAALVGVKFDGNNSYCRLINYKPMEVLSLGKLYATLQFNKQDEIIADSAEPDTIKRLERGWRIDELDVDLRIQYPLLLEGFFMTPADKGPGSNKTGISLMQSLSLYAVEEHQELWAEIYNWIWAVDKNKQPTDEPADEWNHGIDAWRYVIAKRRGKRATLNTGFFNR